MNEVLFSINGHNFMYPRTEIHCHCIKKLIKLTGVKEASEVNHLLRIPHCP